MKYFVTWEIDIDAESPREAAQKALNMQRDETSLATCFKVFDDKGNEIAVDLSEPDEDHCRQCGAPSDNGEGWDGLCGNCADKYSQAKKEQYGR